MSDNFQILRGSSIRLSSRRVCSSALTSSQYLTSMIPESTIACSTAGTREEPAVCSSVQSPTPARHRPGCTSCGRRSRPRRPPGSGRSNAACTSATSRGRSEPAARHSEHPRAHPLRDPPDRAALAGGIPALEHDADLGAGRFDPLLHRHQFALQGPHLAPRTPCASSSASPAHLRHHRANPTPPPPRWTSYFLDFFPMPHLTCSELRNTRSLPRDDSVTTSAAMRRVDHLDDREIISLAHEHPRNPLIGAARIDTQSAHRVESP